MVAASELPIETMREGTTALDLAQTIFGSGVTVISASYSGDIDSAGTYSNADTIAPGVAPSDSGIILSTGDAQDFTNFFGSSNQSNSTSTNTSGINDNAQLNAAAGANTYDAAILDVDFIPTSSLMTMQFVFSSEEYPEFQNSIYQDFFGVWINGQEVQLAVGDGDMDPGNINTANNINMYVDNTNDAYNTEMDGFTITMTLTMNVIPNETNSIRIAIADVSDSGYDSNLMIAANSVQTDLVALTDSFAVYPNGTRVVDVLGNDVSANNSLLTITHINGQVAAVGAQILLPTGQSVTLNSDGTLTVDGDGDTEDFNFTYTVTDGVETDIGMVNASSIPCFVAGTLIATPDGERPAEDLMPGDLVLTQDDGPQPLRWIGTRTVAATGKFAPIHIRANTFGEHRDLLVSPLHRVLIRDNLAEILFGEAEVLVAARDLVNDATVTRREGGQVEYVHLMFDRHQVIFSEGLETESYLPGPQTCESFEAETIAEICAIFPEIDPKTGQGYSQAARRTLKRFEADILCSGMVA
ncbi:MAG: choice-of-anchor L domain-containing protein [Sulfitobacter sp.]|nr:choice-of-anchor L domain-containing protein [Sulfitobacter sp.]